MQIQQQSSQTQRHKPKQKGFTRKQRVAATIGIALLVALAIATILILNAAKLIPDIWATISYIILTVLGVLFTFFALIPILFPPAETPTTHPEEQPIPTGSKTIWHISFPRNPFFTGREELLQQLHDHFTQATTAALTQPQAITGLGGIGKTQLAVEYAYRYHEEYLYILWVNAATREALLEGFVTIARVVALPVKDEHDQRIVVEAAQHWLVTHDHWLLLLDNADDLTVVHAFLPAVSTGHILLTTRESATGTIRGFEVETMDETEGVLFLLRRAKILNTPVTPLSQASATDQKAAADIVKAMDGLPLALDQAGAYVEETRCRLSAYLTSYQKQRDELLKRRGRLSEDHPDSVTTTLSLNVEQVEQRNPTAAELLRFCAFLAPDAIPEEVIMEGASQLSPQLQPLSSDETRLNEAIGILRRYSLVQRDTEKQLIVIHRLVQAVLKASMTDETRRQWAEHTVRAVSQAFPAVEVATWTQCERALPHALACATLIKDYAFTFPEAALLLNQTAIYLHDHAQYKQAEPLLQRALAIREQELGPNHPHTASSLNNLALLYQAQGKYEQATPLYQRALAIREQELGPNHPHTAGSLNNLALLYKTQGKYEQAEPLYQRAIAIDEQALGPKHPTTVTMQENYTALLEAMK